MLMAMGSVISKSYTSKPRRKIHLVEFLAATRLTPNTLRPSSAGETEPSAARMPESHTAGHLAATLPRQTSMTTPDPTCWFLLVGLFLFCWEAAMERFLRK